MRGAATLAGKDLRLFLRSGRGLWMVLQFVLVIALLFSLASTITSTSSAFLLPALVWITILFAGAMCQQLLLFSEVDSGTFDMLRLSIGGKAIFMGKLVSGFLVLFLVQVVSIALFSAFLNVGIAMPLVFISVSTIALAGYSAVITLVGLMASRAQAKETLVPVVAFPLTVPLVIPAVLALAKLLAGQAHVSGEVWLIAGFSAAMCLISAELFEALAE